MKNKEPLKAALNKQCTKCKKEKPLTEYYKYFAYGKWRYRSHCKPCVIEENAEYVKKRSS